MGKPIPDHDEGLARLQAIVHDLRSPDGCPWDREQTHESLTTNMLEEAYEAVEALRSGDSEHMKEELGDVLLQVVLHAEIASQRGAFDLNAIAHAISEKLIRRHPHVYGGSSASTTAAVLSQWETMKQNEKAEAGTPLMHQVGTGLPALARAAKLSNKAAKVGFDWPDSAGVLEKIREELVEVEEQPSGSARRAEEIGDLLFAVANLARKEGLDPEVLCGAANEKFVARFRLMESSLEARGVDLSEASLEEMEDAWRQAKSAISSASCKS